MLQLHHRQTDTKDKHKVKLVALNI